MQDVTIKDLGISSKKTKKSMLCKVKRDKTGQDKEVMRTELATFLTFSLLKFWNFFKYVCSHWHQSSRAYFSDQPPKRWWHFFPSDCRVYCDGMIEAIFISVLFSGASELKNQRKTVNKDISNLRKIDQRVAFDSELALVLREDYPLKWWIPNPFYIGYKNKGLSKQNVLPVCRLVCSPSISM